MGTTDDSKNHERRFFTRIGFEAPARLRLGDTEVDCEVLDVSLQGAQLAVPDGSVFKVGDHCALQIALTLGDVIITMESEIVHLNDSHVGLKCIRIDIDSIVHLRRLLELNVGDPELLKHEIGGLGQRRLAEQERRGGGGNDSSVEQQGERGSAADVGSADNADDSDDANESVK